MPMQTIHEEEQATLAVTKLRLSSDTLEPASEVEQSSREKNQATAKVRRRVLIVDDNSDTRESLATLLREHGCMVRTAYDGQNALETAEEFRPHIVLLDIIMPGESGYKVAEKIRANPVLEGVLLIAISGWAEEDTHWRSKHAGFDYHLVKPINPTALETLLATER
jgi:two-component system, chemotaxis family, CheB/CheR fusion protein